MTQSKDPLTVLQLVKGDPYYRDLSTATVRQVDACLTAPRAAADTERDVISERDGKIHWLRDGVLVVERPFYGAEEYLLRQRDQARAAPVQQAFAEKPAAEMVYFKRRGTDFEDSVPVFPGSAHLHVDTSLITRIKPLYELKK